ncbi:MAG: GNAT family protein [Dehalococcoidia bacterium]
MQTEAVRLRPTTEDDLDFVLKTEQHEENSPFVGQWPREQHRAACNDPDAAHLIIERIGEDRPGGYVILGGLTSPDDCVELRRIAVADKGQRLGKTALQLIKRFVFEELQAHRLWFDVLEHNIRARRLYESEGFLVEGTLRDANRAGDRYESLVLMSMLEHEYQT